MLSHHRKAVLVELQMSALSRKRTLALQARRVRPRVRFRPEADVGRTFGLVSLRNAFQIALDDILPSLMISGKIKIFLQRKHLPNLGLAIGRLTLTKVSPSRSSLFGDRRMQPSFRTNGVRTGRAHLLAKRYVPPRRTKGSQVGI